MALTTEQVALWKRNAEMVSGWVTNPAVLIMQERIIALADEILDNREAQPAPAVPEEMYWQDAPVEGSTRAAAYATGWNACRAAMLKGAK